MPVIIHNKAKILGLQGKASGGNSNHGAALDHRHSSLGMSQLLFKKIAADMNAVTDQILTKAWDFDDYLIERIRVVNASISLTTAVGGIYTAAAKAGIAVVAAGQVYSALTGPTLGVDLTVAPAGLDVLTADNLYLALTTAQGAAASADIYVFGVPLTEAA
jgi:hypothetical protein